MKNKSLSLTETKAIECENLRTVATERVQISKREGIHLNSSLTVIVSPVWLQRL